MQKLFETYEACSREIDYTAPPQAEDGGQEAPALMPVSHTSQQAHICVTLDSEGKFHRAELLPRKSQLIIPATEASAGRAGAKVAPHPLIDKIHYCAKDYKGKKAETFKGGFEAYFDLLTKWSDSEFTHPMVLAVKKYIEKGTLVTDLVTSGILQVDASGELLTKPVDEESGIFKSIQKDQKTKLFDQGDAIVCWKVVGDVLEDRTWGNQELQKQWMLFDAQQEKGNGLCMVSGDVVACATNHPRNIRRPGDGAKLISSNDAANFTFRGRFEEPEQACTVGYETSHKAHNALRWLIARQGYRNGEQAVVAWAVSGARVPNPCGNLLDGINDEDLMRDDAPASSEAVAVEAQPKAPPPNMGLLFAQRLRKALAGYKADLKDTDGVAIMALDAASPGRLSVTFYREQMLEQYLGNLEAWQENCAWVLPVRLPDEEKGKGKKHKRTVYAAYAPLPETIARVAYGRRVDDTLRKATVERLLPCIVDGAHLPRDLVEGCVRRACNRAALEDWEWPEVLGVACAMYKGYRAINFHEKRFDMALDESIDSRDYLYGRLLAVAEYIERTALQQAGEKRATNAERLIQRFADHPYATWRQLELSLAPYMQRLQNSSSAGLLGRAKKILREICDKFSPEAFESPAKLSGEFLLGYHCQMSAFYTKSEKDAAPEEHTQEGA
ncbi:type I-C CRISPR-associated protein Cas8c/Csd1 [Solidesulfovibrio carbinolicus]|nr:type I-C CRISPR-associated protein Cas8c/Csd1 [Solidesulfovibrio carbinolicus]